PDRRKPRGSTAAFRAARPLVLLKDRGPSNVADSSRCRAMADLRPTWLRLSQGLSDRAMSAMRTRITAPGGCRDLPTADELQAINKRIETAAGFSDRPDSAAYRPR